MAIVVEHDKRKKVILEKALELFIEEGYEDVTFQKIADRCGITRTTLYIYFQNKREIFQASIKQLGENLENELNVTIADESLSAAERLERLVLEVYKCCIEHRDLFTVLLTYLLQIQKTGNDPADRVRRRTVKLRHLMSSIIIEGINNGEFRKVEVKTANEMLYGLLESALFQITIMNHDELPYFKKVVKMSIETLKA